MTLTVEEMGAIIHLQSLDYPPHEACRDLGLNEKDFWATLAASDPCSAFATAYCIGRDNRILDENIPKEAGQQAYVTAFHRERGELSDIKAEIIEDAFTLYSVGSENPTEDKG